MFNPVQPHLLYASFRRQSAIYCWDVRGDGSHPVQIYDPSASSTGPGATVTEAQAITTHSPTNQRLKFDIDISGSRLGVGDHVSHVNS